MMIATMFLPPIVTLIPLYRMVSEMGLSGSLAGVILPNMVVQVGPTFHFGGAKPVPPPPPDLDIPGRPAAKPAS